MLSVASVFYKVLNITFSFVIYLSMTNWNVTASFLCQKSVYRLQSRNLHLCYTTLVTKIYFLVTQEKNKSEKKKRNSVFECISWNAE